MQIQKENVERVDENETNIQVFSVKQKQEGRKKLNQRKKISYLDLDMQMDTGSEVTIIPKKFQGMHWKANFTKEQFTTPPI